MAKSNEGSSEPEKSSFELVKKAQTEQQAVITANRLKLIQAMVDHKSIGGQDLVEESLLEIVLKHPKGIQYPFLQIVFPDAALTAAREALKKAGKIEQIGKKGNVVLKPVPQAEE